MASLERAPAPPPSLVWFWRVLRAFARREVLELLSYRTWMLAGVFAFAAATVSLIFFSSFIGAAPNPHLERYGGDYFAFGLCGILVMQLQHVGVDALSHRVRMGQVLGVLEAQLAAPAPAWIALGVAPLYEFFGVGLRSAAYLVGAAFLLDVRFSHVHPGSLALTIPLVLAAFGGLGLVTAAATMVARRANPVPIVLSAISTLLSGVVYPTSVLPDWLRALGHAVPMTPALEALRRTLLTGAAPADIAGSLISLAVFAAVLSPLGLLTFGWALRRARVEGSLTHY